MKFKEVAPGVFNNNEILNGFTIAVLDNNLDFAHTLAPKLGWKTEAEATAVLADLDDERIKGPLAQLDPGEHPEVLPWPLCACHASPVLDSMPLRLVDRLRCEGLVVDSIVVSPRTVPIVQLVDPAKPGELRDIYGVGTRFVIAVDMAPESDAEAMIHSLAPISFTTRAQAQHALDSANKDPMIALAKKMAVSIAAIDSRPEPNVRVAAWPTTIVDEQLCDSIPRDVSRRMESGESFIDCIEGDMTRLMRSILGITRKSDA